MTRPRIPQLPLDLPPWLVMGLTFTAISVVVTALNWHHVEQQTNFWNEYVPMAEHLAGTAPREVLTYPTWGYPFLLRWLPDYRWVTGIQVMLGTVAMTWAWVRTRAALPEHTRLVSALFLAAVPWYALQSVKWPLAVAASLVVLGMLAAERAIIDRRASQAALAGALLGAALHFRSEWLPLLPFLAVVLLWAPQRRPHREWLLGVTVAAAAMLLVIGPWAVHFHRQTGRVSFTASQGGIVAFISLGQLPGNPWGARYEDEYAYEYLTAQGYSDSPSTPEVDSLLMAEFKRRVLAEPLAFARKVAWNSARIMGSGFYNPEPRLTPAQGQEYAILRSALRGVNLDRLRGGHSASAWLAAGYWVVAKAIGVAFVLLSAIGLVGWIRRRQALTDAPLLWLAAGVLVYSFLLQSILTAEPRYLNGLYLFAVPFCCIGSIWLTGRFRRNRTQPGMGYHGKRG